MDKNVIDGLRKRYSNIHPLIFHRSLEHSASLGEIFDILDTFPNKYPCVWCEGEKRWIHTMDIFRSAAFNEENK